MRNVEKDEEVFDEKVIECYYNICRYYNNKQEIINRYIKMKSGQKVVENKWKMEEKHLNEQLCDM